MLRHSAEARPEKEAVIHRADRLSYSEVDAAVTALATGLRVAGLERGDRVGLWLEPSIQQVLSIFAASRANAAFVPINHLLFPEQAAHIMNDCGMKALITTNARLSSLSPLLPQLSSLSFIVIVDDGEVPVCGLPVYTSKDLCAAACSRPIEDSAIEKDLAAILYTSGSTGKPKG